MRILLFLIAVLAFLVGLAVFAGSKSSIHEIEAFALFILSAICLSGAGIIEAINQLRKDVLKTAPSRSNDWPPHSASTERFQGSANLPPT